MTDAGGMTGPTVLVVEDEEPLALLLRYNLEAEGFAVETVARGDEAELRLCENPPDLVQLILFGVYGIVGHWISAKSKTRPS